MNFAGCFVFSVICEWKYTKFYQDLLLKSSFLNPSHTSLYKSSLLGLQDNLVAWEMDMFEN